MKGKIDVLLINMPFGPLFRPSLPLSLLKALFTSMDVSSKVRYFTIPFAERIGTKLYARISNQQPRVTDLAGEFIFTEALYGSCSKNYVGEILRKPEQIYGDEEQVSKEFINEIVGVQSMAASFIDDSVEEILRDPPKILIFSSVFQQQIASLALARRIKIHSPDTFLLFFGNNCHGVMGAETLRQFAFLDAVVSGEIENVIPRIVQSVLSNEPVSDLQGVYTRNNIDTVFENGNFSNAVPVTNMDSLPYPDFDDFFSQHEESKIEKNSKKQLHFETSRGCWWGERSHCTFCGLNSESMFYRSKSPQRALDELLYLNQKYPECFLSAVDTILDMKYFNGFVADLAAQDLNLEIFYEVKANLKKDHVRLLSKAGIKTIQPGVESFSTSLLSKMGKGVKALQNIQLLKWCKEYGIKPFWNFLYGFADEDPEEYARMARLIPLITHLPAPQSMGKIRIERFSPNHKFPEKFGFENVRPYKAYSQIYPFSNEAIANLATYFTYDYKTPRDVAGYTRPLRDQISYWQQTNKSSDLFYVDKGNLLLIWDLRPAAGEFLTVLTGIDREMYLACDSITTLTDLQKIVEQQSGRVESRDLQTSLKRLVESALMVNENKSYLSLAIPLGTYSPNPTVVKKFRQLVQKIQTGPGGEIPVINTKTLCIA